MKNSRTIRLSIAFAVAVLATGFDAISSWHIIELNPIAVEGNPTWSSIAQGLGFGGAMVLRGIIGILLIGILLLVAFRSKRSRVRAIASFGLYFSAAVLLFLSIYHLWFRSIYG